MVEHPVLQELTSIESKACKLKEENLEYASRKKRTWSSLNKKNDNKELEVHREEDNVNVDTCLEDGPMAWHAFPYVPILALYNFHILLNLIINF